MSLARAKREGWAHRIQTKSDEQAVREGCYFDQAAADRVARFFPKFLRHSKGAFAGKPFELIDWQRHNVIEPIFGWKRPNGFRRFTRTYIELPKKNGKSTLAAGIGLYMLCADGEFGANCFSVATDRMQAGIVHGEAVKMVDASKVLTKLLKVHRSTNKISYRKKLSEYLALSASPAGKEGFDGHCAICDELHVWYGRELWDALRYMGRARRQPLIFVITTAGDNLEGVCWEQHEYARSILDGHVIDTRYYPLIYACTAEDLEGDKIYDRTLWRKANPSIGHTIDEEEFGRDLIEAMQSPRSKASFLRYSFNVWSQSVTRWLDAETWKNGELVKEFKRGSVCFAGLDLAKISDMTGLALIFSEKLDRPVVHPAIKPVLVSDQTAPPERKDEKRYHHKAWFWIPEGRIVEIEKENPAMPIREWIAKGFVTVTPGDVTDYATIKRDVLALSKQYNIERIAFDPWNAESLTQELESQGIDRVEFRQTMANYAHPTAEFERLLKAKLLTHDPNPVLDWQARNVTVLSDASGNFRPVKPPHEDHRKIDGIVSGIMGLNEAMLAPAPFTGSPLIM